MISERSNHMSVFKCKMCGGTIEFEQGASVGVCDSCGTKQTLPKLDDDRRANLYDRANHFRRNNEFDKAMGIYETVLNEDPTDAEAYWSIVLCRYGIEYVEDPATRRRVPTVNRAQYTSVLADEDYKSATANADALQKALYEEEARAIDEIQKGILEISQKEEPFDVFICYKETGADGRRTLDSVRATELYHELTKEGFKVFFSRITLEDKLGTAYEPYIFAALHSAKVMVALGTKAEHFNAVWVKNEWSRYLSLIKAGEKKTLIPAYQDMDPYDLPEEFSHLQAQDMSKLGFMQDLIRGIKKITAADGPKAVIKETVVVNNAASAAAGANVAPLLERVSLFLEDGKWQDANIYCEKVLDIDPKNAEAYLGKLMAELNVKSRKQLANCAEPFDNRENYAKVLRFGDEKLESEMRGYIAHINERNEHARLTGIYNGAVSAMNAAKTESAYKAAANIFKSISGFQDADTLMEQCLENAERAKSKTLAIVRALKEGANSKSGPTIEQKLAAAKTRVVYLERILNVYDSTQAQIQAAQNEFRAVISQEKQLLELRSRFGIFAVKDKKRIDEELSAISIRKNILTANIHKNQDSIGNYSSVADVKRDLNYAKKNADDLEAQLESARVSADDEYSFDKAYNIYLNEPDIAKCVNDIYPAATFIPVIRGKTNTFKFGRYITKKGRQPESIEWQVLAREAGRMLVISKYALDCQEYNTSYTNVTWETCSLRKWLNGTFLSAAFSSEEQSSIISSTVTADKNPSHRTSPGNNTTDKVFLLSITEANKYFGSDKARRCAPTDYAIAQEAYTSGNYSTGGRATCWWWLRSPGSYSMHAAYVNYDGSVGHGGHGVFSHSGAVRPALWINLGS